MAGIISNQLKVAVFLGDMYEANCNISQDDCFTVQQYDYDSGKCRNHLGLPTGNNLSVMFNFSIRNFEEKILKQLLKAIKENNPNDYTFIINAVFDPNRRLKDFDDSFIARGYVVSLEEIFEDKNNDTEKEGQSLLHISLLISKITFKGDSSDHILSISND